MLNMTFERFQIAVFLTASQSSHFKSYSDQINDFLKVTNCCAGHTNYWFLNYLIYFSFMCVYHGMNEKDHTNIKHIVAKVSLTIEKGPQNEFQLAYFKHRE